MELFLNVLWVMLAVPAIWVWRREATPPSGAERLGSLRCLLVLSCTLTLLFPVVSATDDLHAMRPEMEESSPSKRAVRPTAGGKSLAWLSGVQSPALFVHSTIVCFNDQVCGKFVTQSVSLPVEAQSVEGTGRAPPISLLS
jgi:hypothetical protein